MKYYDLIAATGCATGVAHTYMAQEALEKAAQDEGLTIKVETHGQTGIENTLSDEEIKQAKAVIVAADIDVDIDRFSGKKVVIVPVAKAIKDAKALIVEALDANTPIFKSSITNQEVVTKEEEKNNNQSIINKIYTSLMNGVSHMLPLVVAGGVLVAISFFWGIYSADPKSDQYNQLAYMLNTIGSTTMNLMVPVLAAYIGEAIAKRSGLVVGFAAGMLAYNGGAGFLGAIVGGYIAGGVVLVLQKILAPLPDKEFRGLKAIFLYPVLGVLIAGMLMLLITTPMKALNLGMMDFLKNMQDASPVVLGIIVGAMCAFDFGGPINKAAYLTGTALLAQGNYYFMAGVSAACIAPPLATGFAVLLKPKAYTKDERSAGYVNFLLGSTHITEGAIPFAAKNPLLNIPAFMVGSAVASVLTYISKIEVPAPHGGFIILPLVNHPFLWVVYILIGAFISGILLAIIANRKLKKEYKNENTIQNEDNTQIKENIQSFEPTSILEENNIFVDVDLKDKDDVLKYLANLSVENGIANNAEKVYEKYIIREKESSTGMEQGIAIPHAQDETIKDAKILIVKLNHPIKWDSLDGSLVDTIISFLIPENGSKDHLKYLSNMAKLLMNQNFVTELKHAHTSNEIKKLFFKYSR
ncbi:fructose-specific PTS transporter subunit EIIC [Ligilactobacillus sp. Marseille-Q7487]|uniref:fructose-specific PTS transporter subunit EIIC n=1 Tax=Ligilactobacillus sp. Marseille-Q7487 TaxID=3022128 RepID=UPI0024A89516|nr:fructose-specific PTS transporter subunit EIIC [Ligilactobacillus sp. Marseille-Q7487]